MDYCRDVREPVVRTPRSEVGEAILGVIVEVRRRPPVHVLVKAVHA
jgi:hypothetical protein